MPPRHTVDGFEPGTGNIKNLTWEGRRATW
jgi:hypothetical protein